MCTAKAVISTEYRACEWHAALKRGGVRHPFFLCLAIMRQGAPVIHRDNPAAQAMMRSAIH